MFGEAFRTYELSGVLDFLTWPFFAFEHSAISRNSFLFSLITIPNSSHEGYQTQHNTTMASLSEEDPVFSYSQFACIGTGFSGIALGATLQRWYGITDIRFFDKQSVLGGTWHINQYPGCACDVPSALYSLSFECNPNWTRVLPTYAELWAYLNRVAAKYDLTEKMTFDCAVEKCVWIEERGRWRMWIRQKKTGQVVVHECQFLYSGVGHFDQPRELDIRGAERFEGPMFHSARWQHDVDLTGKKVVVFGNGCTGAQIVPAIVEKTSQLTQVVRSKHWVYPAVDEKVPKWLMFTLANIPGTMQIQRALTFVKAEIEYIGFGDGKIAKAWRKNRQRQVEAYMRKTAPKKYHDLLIPDFEVGCKRRIFDSGYLESLHNEHLRLTDEPVEEILPNGVRMKSGEIVEADVIVLANGFKTNQFFLDCEIVGRGGQTIHEHWDSFGGAEAYNCESLSGFPNFFLLGGKLPIYFGTLPTSQSSNSKILTLPSRSKHSNRPHLIHHGRRKCRQLLAARHRAGPQGQGQRG